ncbi:MAG: hypothetical protein BAJATHORv1_30512 [Candidatus Thorarchaeota archaeon]|nr:MAG: hypothetical protein BAJATHORv1_30512 [Candidatus Thorarchaeota archaeon]
MISSREVLVRLVIRISSTNLSASILEVSKQNGNSTKIISPWDKQGMRTPAVQFDMFDPFNMFDSIFGFMSIFFIIIPIFVIVIFAIVFIKVCQSGSQAVGSFTLRAPSFAIPDQYRQGTRSDGSSYRTVRLPEKCPSCNASLSQEDIDWTGPLEARCNYCGSTVRAKFESV